MHSGVYMISVLLLLATPTIWSQVPTQNSIQTAVPAELLDPPNSVLLQYPHYYRLLRFAVEDVVDCYEDEQNTVKVIVTIPGFMNMLHSATEPPRNTKCLRYCIMHKNNLFADNNQLTLKEWSVFLCKLYDERITDAQVLQIAEICKNSTVNVTDRCERGHAGAMCIIDNMHKLGIMDV